MNSRFAQLGLLCTLFVVCHHWPAVGQESNPADRTPTTALRIDSIQDVVAKWKPDRHLFVKGDVGVGEEQLQKLQDWLAENGPHWTVVLMESASGETYNAPDGRSYVGLDAVEYALGHGLSNRTAFGEWVHPETNEADGAIFALFLKERKFSYFASDAQDRRRLGEANWIGQLDQPAFRAMRNGGRIIDAVKDTVQHINGRLTAAIQAEAADKQRREDELQRTLAVLGSSLESIKRSIDRVEAIGGQWAQEFKTATGPLAKPPVAAWRQKALDIENQLEKKDVATVTQQKANLATEVDRYLNMYAASADFEAQRKQIADVAQGYKTSMHTVAQKGASEIEAILDVAKQQRSQGSFEFVETLRNAAQKVSEVQAAVEQEEKRLELEKARADLIRSTVWGTSIFFLGLVGLVLYILHRRRTPLMKQAIQEIQKREKSIREETEQIDQLFERNRELLGSEERVKERGYTGRTKEVALQALQYVDDLFIMSKEIRRVLADAKILVEPTSWSVRLLNLFSARKYQEAIHLVTGAPLGFYAETGVPRILKDFIQQKKTGEIPSNLDEVEVTFEEVYSALDQRGNEAQQRLDLFEKSLTTIDEVLNKLQKEIEEITTAEKELHQKFGEDGLFELPSLIQQVLPSLQADLKAADEQSGFDAIGAIEGPVSSLTRKLAEARAIVRVVNDFRNSGLPKIAVAEQKIEECRYDNKWIDVELQQVSLRTNQVLDQLLTQSVAPEIDSVAAALAALTNKTHDVGLLAERLEKELLPSLVQLEQTLENARGELAKRLNLRPELVFEESEQDPDLHQQRANKDLQAAKAMLNEGQYASAVEATELGVKERDRAIVLIQSSLTAVDEFEAQATEIETRRELCLKMAGELNDKVNALAEQFQPSAFLFDNASSHEGRDQSVPESLRSIVTECDKVECRAKDAKEALEKGRVLNCADLQRQCLEHIEWLEQKCIHVEEHLQQIENLAAQNLSHYVKQQRESASWEEYRSDPLICDRTLIEMSKLQDEIARLEIDIVLGQTTIPSPFDTEDRLVLIDAEIEKIKSAFVADRQAHAEAKRAVDGAERQLEVAFRSVTQAQTDNVPDSPLTSELNRRIQSLSRELEEAKQELRVPHGNWHTLDDKAAKLQSSIVSSTQQLNAEMDAAKRALEAFETASRTVFQAQQWSGPFGLRVTGMPGSQDLERARYGLQTGNYSVVLEISRLAAMAAQAAIEQMEREVRRRKMEADREAEQRRRERERSSRSSSFSSSRSSSSRSFSSSSSSSSSSRSSSSGGSSGFSRSGW